MATANTANALNGFLADATVLYQKLRAMHWLVDGRQFFQLHTAFEKYYDAWADHIDDIAERILTVGGKPLGTLSEMLATAQVKEFAGPATGVEMVKTLSADLQHMVDHAKKVIAAAEEAGDRGTANLLDDIVDEQEKNLWMLRAWLAE